MNPTKIPILLFLVLGKLPLIIVLLGCAESPILYYQPPQVSGYALKILTPNQLNEVDMLENHVTECLKGLPNPLPYETRIAAWCQPEPILFNAQIIKVIVEPNPVLSCAGNDELLSETAPEDACRDKVVSEQCRNSPCHYRAAIQGNDIVVTTPNFYVFKDPILRLMTGCYYPWSDINLSLCMKPETNPLDVIE